MKRIILGDKSFLIKNYYCSEDGSYIQKEDGKLWIYVNVTDICQANCPFCVNPSKSILCKNSFNIESFGRVLKKINPFVYGISLTGGEPMLNTALIEDIVVVVKKSLDSKVELDMVTNGINLDVLPKLRGIQRFSSIHISRHGITDEDNEKLMGWKSPTEQELRELVHKMPDPGMITFNCVLQKGGVSDLESMADYLEMSARIGVLNTSFIGLFLTNDYCMKHYISPAELDFSKDSRFRLWNHFHDYQYCQCSSGDYLSQNGYVRFYYRCPGNRTAPYVRQLVYTADNRLLDGFGGSEIHVL